jgi:formylglycine-generating enzyme required for sulfatase activity
MERRVFISYSSQDKPAADQVCGALENAGIPCWIAPRNIEAGADFPSAILQGIANTQAVVILLSDHAMASPHVLSEIEHAFNAKKRLLPVRLCSTALPQDFEYFLSTPQWLDASGGLTDATLKRLVDAVTEAMAGKPLPDNAESKGNRTTMIIAGFAIVLLIAAIFGYSRFTARPKITDGSGNKTPDPSLDKGKVATENKSAAPKIWTNPQDGLKYVWIPPGSFTMGCSAADSECDDSEKPPHSVQIPTGFWLGQTEATIAAYRKIEPAKAGKSADDPELPVRGLSWPEAKAYCIATGGRLPTEAEWEYAARAGTAEPYYGVPSKIAWYERDSDRQPHPVGLKEPNAFGLYDMLGNVSEWVLDRYYNKYDLEADAVGSNIDQPLAGNASAVARGGFWDAELPGIRVSHRSEMPNDQGVETAGVRCANDHH